MDEMFPDGYYRPIPIVWFTAALAWQVLLLFVGFFVLYALAPAFTVAWSVAVTFVLLRWTWRRGMKHASRGWKVAVVLALAINLALFSIAAQDRIPFSG